MTFRKVAARLGLALLAGFVALALAVIVDGWQAFGHRSEGARLARMQRSPQWRDGHFRNPEPLHNFWLLSLAGAFDASAHGSPERIPQVVHVDPRTFDTPPVSGLRVTWFGHSSTLVEIDGTRVLTDPIWSERPSPVAWIGPKRWYAPPVALADLPPIDAVVVSHDHYDHLDFQTIRAMRNWHTTFVVPLGLGAHLAYWGVPESRIVELDWWERTTVGALTIVCTPARHASGRMLIDDDATLWAGYALVGATHRVYFSGDTGLFPAMRVIGTRLGPFDLAMIETGQYHAGWPDWHIGPEQALTAHAMVRGRALLPIHWALFALAYHGWTEPIERTRVAGLAAHARVATPRPGESIEPTLRVPTPRWWPRVPWQTAREAPIVSSQVSGAP